MKEDLMGHHNNRPPRVEVEIIVFAEMAVAVTGGGPGRSHHPQRGGAGKQR